MGNFSISRNKKAISFFRGSRIETEITYEELTRDSNRMANTFRHLGVKNGDRAVLYVNKSLIFVIMHLALQKIGAISVPLNPGFKKAEMSYLLKDADPKLVLSEPEHEDMIKDIVPGTHTIVIDTKKSYQDQDVIQSATEDITPVDIRPEDPGLIIYTSGTTGNPKGAVLTHKNLTHNTKNIIKTWAISEDDVLCHALPLFHVHGLCFALHTALMAGSHVLMFDQFAPQRVIEVLAKKEGFNVCTIFMAVPSMYTSMLDFVGDRKFDLKHMRLWTSGSAPLLTEDFKKITRIFGKEPVEREGMSETGINFSNPINGIKKPGTIGLPLPGLKVRIVDPETFKDVSLGETGEIWLKSPAITPGYWQKPEETARAFEKGWFRTGDLGKVDEDGYYYLTDRLKHIIISGGENISPKEIETIINKMEDVVESSVVGIKSIKWGEKVVAAVTVKPGSQIKSHEIQAFCKEYLHNWKCPKEIVVLKELPRNTMGKLLKEEVKKLFK